MIHIILRPEVKRCGSLNAITGEIGWAVLHNAMILAYCDSEAEAVAVRDALANLVAEIEAKHP